MSKRDLPLSLHVSGPARGGIRSHLRLLARHLPAHGYQVHLLAPAALVSESAGGSSLPLTERASSALSPRVFLSLTRSLRALKPAVLHAHGYKAAVAVRLAGVLVPRVPRVITLHNLWPVGTGTRDSLALRAVSSRAAIIAVSPAVADSVRVVAPGAEITVIGNGIEIEQFGGEDVVRARAALGLDPNVAWVGYVGRLTREKGADLALAAVASLRERGLAVRLLIVGDGPERERLVASAGPGALFLGEREDVPRLLAACDVVVTPSRSEGQSVVALEAMAAGRAVVATRVGGLAALAEAGGGLVVPPEDVPALAAALQHLLADPADRASRAASGRAHVVAHASAEAVAAAVASLYTARRRM